jgi:hypothetical protein
MITLQQLTDMPSTWKLLYSSRLRLIGLHTYDIVAGRTTRITGSEVGGEDHLGLEGAAQSYQQWLAPGIITTTDHARYYSLYNWILQRFVFDPTSSRRIADFRVPTSCDVRPKCTGLTVA